MAKPLVIQAALNGFIIVILGINGSHLYRQITKNILNHLKQKKRMYYTASIWKTHIKKNIVIEIV